MRFRLRRAQSTRCLERKTEALRRRHENCSVPPVEEVKVIDGWPRSEVNPLQGSGSKARRKIRLAAYDVTEAAPLHPVRSGLAPNRWRAVCRGNAEARGEFLGKALTHGGSVIMRGTRRNLCQLVRGCASDWRTRRRGFAGLLMRLIRLRMMFGFHCDISWRSKGSAGRAEIMRILSPLIV